MSKAKQKQFNYIIIRRRIGAVLSSLFVVGIFSWMFFSFYNIHKENTMLEGDVVHVRAFIVNKTYGMGNHSVVDKVSYGYEFSANGKTYEGNSGDLSYKIGNGINIVYAKGHPELNRPER